MRTTFHSIVALALTVCIGPMVLAEGQPISVPVNNTSIADTYPHIGALENAILGQSFPGQPLPERLGRMENKAFGTVSIKPDLSDRTDDLDEYTEKTLHKNLLQADVDSEAEDPAPVISSGNAINSANNQLNSNQADYPHVTSLEQAILGQTYVGQPLPDRLSRMETKAFGKASDNAELSDRTDALEAYAEIKLHKPPSTNQDSNITEDNTGNQSKGGMFSKVGQALLGMAGGSALNSVMGNSFGGLGPNLGGLGSTTPGSGFGGINVRRRQAPDQQQEPAPQAPTHPEDPAVYQPTPPDTSAKLIVKVGWCEVKVFGHTFPNMHLPERLGQLNHELNLEPGKSNIQLMDDIGLMIKTVQSRKQAASVVHP